MILHQTYTLQDQFNPEKKVGDGCLWGHNIKTMTPWFDKYTRPHHIGVYPTRVDKYDLTERYNHWNGLFWGLCSRNIAEAERARRLDSYIQHIEWRGFTEEQR